ncbi:MAG: permease [Cyanobacteriota bacterium]
MEFKKELKVLLLFIGIFLLFYFLPIENTRLQQSLVEALALTKWYAQEHVLLCLIPAFFIAGAISVFISQNAVMKYLGAKANKILAYSVASVSGSVLAVCSCTVLPLFAGIYKMGAGIGPATTFLYSGPAINVLAIILTANVLGFELGFARAVGAILFSVIIGLLMHLIFAKEEEARNANAPAMMVGADEEGRPLYQNALFMAVMVGILVFANWGSTNEMSGLFYFLYIYKWIITALFSIGLGVILVQWFKIEWWKILVIAVITGGFALLMPTYPIVAFTIGVAGLTIVLNTKEGETHDWLEATWGFAKQILPLLLIGVLIAGLLLGRVGHEGLIPSEWISGLVGGNSLQSNLFASVVGAFMYFATLTEIPIVQGLIDNGMGHGPALALLLAGPALSLPNMLVIRSVMGTRKTFAFVLLVIIMATASGYIYGMIF